jgi:hypothetical protein
MRPLTGIEPRSGVFSEEIASRPTNEEGHDAPPLKRSAVAPMCPALCGRRRAKQRGELGLEPAAAILIGPRCLVYPEGLMASMRFGVGIPCARPAEGNPAQPHARRRRNPYRQLARFHGDGWSDL